MTMQNLHHLHRSIAILPPVMRRRPCCQKSLIISRGLLPALRDKRGPRLNYLACSGWLASPYLASCRIARIPNFPMSIPGVHFSKKNIHGSRLIHGSHLEKVKCETRISLHGFLLIKFREKCEMRVYIF